MDPMDNGPILFCCILDFGKGSKLLKLCNELGGIGGIVFLGKGTLKNELLNILGITEVRKEVFITIIDKELEDEFYDKVSTKFDIEKLHHGVAFSMPLKYYLKANSPKKTNSFKTGDMDVIKMTYEAIFIIVDKGSIDDVLEAAESAGSTGGTIIHARGAGTQKKETLFNIQIEPEKDMILILSEKDKTESIVDAVAEKLNIHEPNAGIIFVMDVSRTAGLYKE